MQMNIIHNAGRAEGSLQVDFKGSSLIVTVVVVLAIIMAVQTTVIFIVVMFLVCKRSKNSSALKGDATTITANLEGGEQLYEVVDQGGNGVTPKAKPQHGKAKQGVAGNSYTLKMK